MIQMQVTVKLFSYYRGIPRGRIGGGPLNPLGDRPLRGGILTINGKSGTVKDRLEMGNWVSLIPIIGGG